MAYLIRGNLCGFICQDCKESITNATIRLYHHRKDQEIPELTEADPKDTMRLLNEKEIQQKKKYLIAEAQTDQQGNYTFKLDEKKYQGGSLEVDVYLESVPHQTSDPKKNNPVQFTLTSVQPRWRQSENDMFWYWEYCINQRFWCYIRSLFDAWVICGRVLACDIDPQNPDIPLSNVDVTAFDADWIHDDELGTATTDSQGYFRIDYSSKDFKKTFLSPVINVETPFPPFNSGPDLYFKIFAGGTEIYSETRQDGKTAERNNVGNCFCIDLCVEDFIPGEGETEFPSAWTGIGTAFTIPAGVDLNDFDVDGYAGTKKYALTSAIRLTGQAPLTQNGNPIEYRFLISDTTAPNGAAPVPAINFDKIVGVHTGSFAPTKVGKMMAFFPVVKIVDIYAQQSDLDSEGWLDVNKSVLRTFTDDPLLDPLELNASPKKWFWIDEDALMAVNTNAFTNASNVPDTAASVGDPVPPAQRIGIEKIALRFEIREVIDKSTNTFSYLPGSGQTLNSVIVNNNAAFMKLDIKEQLTNACSGLSGDVHAMYTVAHPHLEDVNIHVRSNDNTVNKNLNDGFIPLVNNISPAVVHGNNANLKINAVPNDLIPCSYIVTLSLRRRLHTGDGAVGVNNIQKSFCYG